MVFLGPTATPDMVAIRNTLLRTLVIVLSFAVSTYCWAQPFPNYPVGDKQAMKTDTLPIAKWTWAGLTQIEASEYNNALTNLRKAADQFEPHTSHRSDTLFWEWYLYLNTYMGLCRFSLGDYRGSIHLLNNTLAKARKHIGLQKALTGKIHHFLALSYLYYGSSPAALNHYQKALDIFVDTYGPFSYDVANCYNDMGTIYKGLGRYTEAINHIQHSLDIYQKVEGEESTAVASAYSNIGTLLHEVKGDYEKAMDHYQKALAIRLEQLGSDHSDVAVSYFNIGNLFLHLGQIENGLGFLHKALAIDKGYFGDNHLKTALRYGSIASAYFQLGQTDLALEYQLKALAIQEEALGPENPQNVETYANLAAIYTATAQLPLALEYAEKAADIVLEFLGPNQIELASCYIRKGTIYDAMGWLEEALAFRQKALDVQLAVYKEKNSAIANSYASLGSLYAKLGSTQQALNWWQQAIDIFEKLHRRKSPRLTEIYNETAEAFHQQNNYNKALLFCQKALAANSQHYLPDDLSHNPTEADSVISKMHLVESLRLKGAILYDSFLVDTSLTGYLLLADQSYQQATALDHLLRKSYKRASDKQGLLEKALEAHEGHLRVCLALQRQASTGGQDADHQKNYASRAFDILENSRAILLLESMQYAKARSFAGIPDSLLQEEERLKSRVAFYEKSRFEERQKGANVDSTKLALWAEKEFYFKQAADQLIQSLEKDHPDYFRLRYDTRTVDLIDVKAMLEPDQMLIEYFVGTHAIYAYLVSPNGYNIVEIPLDFPLVEWVQNLYAGLHNYWLLPTDQQTNQQYDQFNQLYTQHAQALYKKLIQPLGNLPEKLVIIPDGVLGYLPFEALLMNAPSNPASFKTHPYLCRKHLICYNYSATLWKEMRDKKHQNTGLLALAPLFEKRCSNLNKLWFNIPEAEQIAELFDGKSIAGAGATRQAFLQQAPNYAILHLATHAVLDDRISDYSFLAFACADDTTGSDKVFIRDLYTQRFPADLVVLSACETGIGQLQRGEGIVSLARGFAFAGAKSIVMSLWEVNDQSASAIMTDFYQALKNGNTKETALRKAKMAYIDNQIEDQMAHPFYWAMFVGMGDMSQIGSPPGLSMTVWVVGLGVVGLLLYFGYRTKT